MKKNTLRSDTWNSKSIPEMLSIAREDQERYIHSLPARELEDLFSGLNRFRYSLKDQGAFIRLYLAVHSFLCLRRDSNAMGPGGFG